jgi:hypothetical protein
VETEAAPILANLIKEHGLFFDEVFGYCFHGHGRYIIRWPHLNGQRWNYRMPTEKPKDPFQKKLLEADC